MKLHTVTLAMALSALAVVPSYADTILAGTFSSQTPPYETDTGNSWEIGTPTYVELAVGFQDPDAVSYLLSQIQMALNFSVSNPDAATDPLLNYLNLGSAARTIRTRRHSYNRGLSHRQL